MTKEELLGQLESLVREPGYLHSLALMVTHDLSVDVQKVLEIDWHSRISFREFALLFGLLVKQPICKTIPSLEDLQRHNDSTYRLLHQLHTIHTVWFKKEMEDALQTNNQEGETDDQDSFKQIVGSGQWMTEPIFYGGSGAYGFQFLELAQKRYELDGQWLTDMQRLSVKDMVALAHEIKELQERKAVEFPIPEHPTHEDACRKAMSVLSFRGDELVAATAETRRSFLKIFSLIPGNANQGFMYPGSYNEVESHPLIILGDDEYFLPIWFDLTQSIYESPFYWMLKDSQYRELSFKHRGEATESICDEMLATVCGRDKVFKDVKIYRNKRKVVTDADVLALLGNKAIVIQAKSKKLTELARQGNEEKLKSDFKDGIQKAYDQGLACRNAILDRTAEFISEKGEKIIISEAVDEAYIVCVTSDEYPALIHQAEAYLSKTLSDPYPIVVSIFDLEILTFYLRDPFDLFYYARQRTKFAAYFRGDEMSLLAYHLKQKIYPVPGVDYIYVDQAMAQLIDANFPVARGYQEKSEAFERLHHRWRNDPFEILLSHVKRARHPRITDGVFFLLDLSGESADALMDGLSKIKSRAQERDKTQVFTMSLSEGRSGVSAVAVPRVEVENIGQRTLAYAMARKYELRSEQWLGLGTVVGSPYVVDSVVYSTEPWTEDPTLEEMAKMLNSGRRQDEKGCL